VGRLVVVRAEGGPSFVDALLDAWDRGDAVLPLDPRLPAPAAGALTEALRVGESVEDGDAVVVPTSGTTGDPKGVVLTHEALRASAMITSARLNAEPERDTWLSCLPLAHIGGLSVVVRSMLTGTPLTFDPDAAATLVSLVPTQLPRMDVSRFRAVLLGGAAPPDDPPPNCIVTYGMTETGSGVVYDGRPLNGVDVRCVDGELHVRGPMLFRCYRDGVDPKDADGWFPTADAGSVDEEGTVHVVGRIGDVIVTGGEKVWPDPVERVVRRISGVGDVAVAGRPDAEWGQRVVAWIIPAGEPPSLDVVRAAVKEELPAYCAPKEVVLVETLPRTAVGKVKRGDLDLP
jgi:O-succinylbenzoic acid--CoA ligase